VQKSGSFFSYGEVRLGQGRNNAKQFLQDNPELSLEIETKVRTALGIGAEAPVVASSDEAPIAEAQAA
jgi:recombination protein RecA